MSQSLSTKFKDPQQGVYFIGTTPPKHSTDDEQMSMIADKLLARLMGLDYDGLVVYDIQDESSRIASPRPFPFAHTRDAREYSALLATQSSHEIITYKSVAQRDGEAFKAWLHETRETYHLHNLVLVGSPSSEGDIRLNLNDAYQILKNGSFDYHLGGVTIAERHALKGNEHERLMNKTLQGCEFFISQAVYNPQATIDLLTSYARSCRLQNQQPKRIILTFAPCGSAKTLEFMEWLGISIPEATRWRILDSEKPLSESVKICQTNLDQILSACRHLDLPLGLNIESLTNRKEEIDASVHLFKLLKATLDLHLAQKALESV
ncbi:hypothetical protein DN062_11610 [Nitrincola tibetensis]|uniref:Methylenetetrahydrofolate reductase (NAD(P)H) n=1 Tax=Nitrincola tibetensis TaxID=2219697 RepID=A0A364NKM6_9GAMM|nr:hypothetical protein [Nitrincola tibetensis]RAU17646.1 hypothetical protein DN062_11610 [Nitrincola tibetensis]